MYLLTLIPYMLEKAEQAPDSVLLELAEKEWHVGEVRVIDDDWQEQ